MSGRIGASVLMNRSGGMRMRAVTSLIAGLLAVSAIAVAPAQDLPKVTVAMSGWTGFAPLSLAEKTGIVKKNGVDVTIKFIPQKDRHLAIASGDVQCAATTVETWILWNANGVATRQVVQLDKSYGADGMVVRNNIARIADLKGKTVAASAPGTAPYFTLAWMLKQTGEQFEKSQSYLRWQNREANRKFFAGEIQAFSKEATDLLLELGIIKTQPDVASTIDTRFIK